MADLQDELVEKMEDNAKELKRRDRFAQVRRCGVKRRERRERG